MPQDSRPTPAVAHLRRKSWRRRSYSQFGSATVERIGMPQAPFGDAFHFLMRTTWPVFCVAFAAYYLLINVLFGAVYYWDIAGIDGATAHSFGEAFMFSVQTIATIGYGHLVPKSTFVNAIVVFESMAAFLGLSLWTGLAFSRFSRPTARVMFSSQAIVTTDDGVPTLMFRVANGRGNRIVDASLTVTLLKNEINAEGMEWRRQVDLKLVRARSAVFALSWTVLHRIDAASPLAGIKDIAHARMAPQLIVSLLGIDDTFGQPIHAMQYYEAKDILRGKRFVDMASIAEDGHRVLDFTHFDEVEDDPQATAAVPTGDVT